MTAPGRDWLLWQLADSAFPVGGFAHSGGLEAAVQHGEVEDLDALLGFLRDGLWQAGHGGLPLVTAAHEDPAALPALDARCDAFLLSTIANRASRKQGGAFLATCERVFGPLLPAGLRALAPCAHHAPLFGAVLAALGVERADAQRLFLQIALRGPLSAAVRLNRLGPQQAQRVQLQLAPLLEQVHGACRDLGPQGLAQTAPRLDLLQATHDRLYSRLFLS